MRGGLDDALDKLARRDELRRRAASEATGTPPAVQELVEAIAAVVARNPKLEVTVGVEGAGDPTLLHFFVDEGTVQVTADSSVASRVREAAPTSPRHADFDIDLDMVDEPSAAPAAHAYSSPSDSGQQTRRLSYDVRDRYDPGTGYGTTAYGEPDPYSRPDRYPGEPDRSYEGYRRPDERATSAARNGGSQSPSDVRPLGNARESAFPSSDFEANGNLFRGPSSAAATPPPEPAQTTRRIRPEQHRAPGEPSVAGHSKAGEATPRSRGGEEPQRGIPVPLAQPIPLKVDSDQTEMAAKRVAALLRDNPTLLRRSPPE